MNHFRLRFHTMSLALPHINTGEDCGIWPETLALVRLALSEDVGAGDAPGPAS